MTAWRDADSWPRLVERTACPLCSREPHGVLVSTPSSWITSAEQVACRGYVCVVARRHVTELFQLERDELAAFFADVARAASVVDELFRPVKLNYAADAPGDG